MTILLGCIADDFTGATDLANNLVRAGMRTVQTIGTPVHGLASEADAVVVALKSRTIPAREAVAQSLAALQWLQAQGAQQIYFKYCSTFDSTPGGNIGPVTEALLETLVPEERSRFTIATPAFPDNGRTVFRGYLFVGDVLLHESGMQNHPLTPMTDSNLVRVLQAQCTQQVGLVDYRVVGKGAGAIRDRMEELRRSGVRIAIVDAISNDDLRSLGQALKDRPLVTAGSGLAIGLPANFGMAPSDTASDLPPASGGRAIVSGSCSEATQRQVQAFIASGGASYRVDPLRAASGVDVATQALSWAQERLSRGPVLIYSTAQPHEVKAAQEQLGVQRAGEVLEQVLAEIARGLVERGARQLVIAGGETAGAAVQSLAVAELRIGPQIDPGVPWCYAQCPVAPDGLHLALKSGNFGADDFHEGLCGIVMNELQAREEICRIGQSLFARGYAHGTAGNISVRLPDDAGYLITPTDACLGFLEPSRLARIDAKLAQIGGDRASKTMALHAEIYAAAMRYDPATCCVIHTHSTHCVALTLRQHEQELLPPVTPYFVMKVGHVPVVPYDRPGSADVAKQVGIAIRRYGDAGTPIRAVMLSRLGPNVWHGTPSAAMAVLEELEETARLVCTCQVMPDPLGEAQIDELRRVFGARW